MAEREPKSHLLNNIEEFRLCPKRYEFVQTIGLTTHSTMQYYMYCRERMFLAAVQWIDSKRGGTRKISASFKGFIGVLMHNMRLSRPQTIETGSIGKMAKWLARDKALMWYHLPRMIPTWSEVIGSNIRYELFKIRSSLQCLYQIGEKVHILRLARSDWPRQDLAIQLDHHYVCKEYGVTPSSISWLVINEKEIKRVKVRPWPIEELEKEARDLVVAIEAGGFYRNPSLHCDTCPFKDPCTRRKDGNEEDILDIEDLLDLIAEDTEDS